MPTAPKTMISLKDYLNGKHPCYFLLSGPMLVYHLLFYFSIPSFGLKTLDLIQKEQSSTGWSLTFAGLWQETLCWYPTTKGLLIYKCGSLLHGGYLTHHNLYHTSFGWVFRGGEARAWDSYVACIGVLINTPDCSPGAFIRH